MEHLWNLPPSSTPMGDSRRVRNVECGAAHPDILPKYVKLYLFLPQNAFASAIFSYLRTLLRLNITEEELAMFTSTLLICPQRAGLSDTERINSLHRTISDSFQHLVSDQFCSYFSAIGIDLVPKWKTDFKPEFHRTSAKLLDLHDFHFLSFYARTQTGVGPGTLCDSEPAWPNTH